MPTRTTFSFTPELLQATVAPPTGGGALHEIPGVVTSMLVALGRSGITTVEDLAACATDDLLGWTERRGEQITNHPGILGDMPLTRKECDAIILHARVRAGWIEANALQS